MLAGRLALKLAVTLFAMLAAPLPLDLAGLAAPQ